METCNTTITDQFKLLLTEICRITSSPLPEEMQKLAPPDYSAVPVEDSDSDSSVILLSDDEDLPLNASCSKTVAEPTAKELSAEQQNILKRLEEKQYYQHNLNVRRTF